MFGDDDDDQDSPSAAPSDQDDDSQPGPGADSEPNVHNGGVNLYPYSDEIKNHIVDQHNLARATMVPVEAANMRELKWNEVLAIEASEFVEKCVFEHDTKNNAYGQNLLSGAAIDRDGVTSWIKMWVQDELARSSSGQASDGHLELNHASAVLWANSYYVGCASKSCSDGCLTACNYFIGGNVMGERAFVPGTACSKCPTQASQCDAKYGKLCTTAAKNATTPRPSSAPTRSPASRSPKPTPAQTLPDNDSDPYGGLDWTYRFSHCRIR